MRRRRTVTPCAQASMRRRDSGVHQSTVHPNGEYTRSLAPAVYDPPIVPLHALLLADSSPEEIIRRLKLNLAIRILLDAIAEREVAS